MVKAIEIECYGETRTVPEWARLYKLPAKTLWTRLHVMGWPMAKALTEPIRERNRRGGRPKAGVPRTCPPCKRHPSGRAYSRWKMHGSTHERYFGKFGSEEAAQAYRRFAAEWATGSYERSQTGAGLTVLELVAAWLQDCRTVYVKDGRQTSEITHCKPAAAILADLYGSARASDFTPDAMRACRATFVGKGYTRGTVNGYTSRIVRCFAWGASRSLVPVAVHAALALVEPLAAGRTTAPDRERKKVATETQVAATIPHLAPTKPERAAALTAMIRLQRLTGMRPGEVCALRPCEVDRAGDVWIYTVGKANKNRHRGKRQTYYVGPKGIAILRPFLDGPADQPAFGVSRIVYTNSIATASVRAGVEPWAPHQLRHALATEVARRFGSLDHAAAAIGDSAAVAQAVYVHMDPREKAKIEVAKEMG